MKFNLLHVLIAGLVLMWFSSKVKESFGSGRGTLMQLSASSGYYPFWRYGYGYRWPYYRYIYPYAANHPNYTSYAKRGMYPKPNGSYRAFQGYD